MRSRVFSFLLALILLCPFLVPVAASSSSDDFISGSHYVAAGLKVTLKTPEEVSWGSEDSKIAKISKNGVVKGIRPGTVRLYAQLSDGSYRYWKMTVTEHAAETIEIIASKTKLNLGKYKKLTLKAAASPSGAAQHFLWKSSDPSVATVSSSGKVTARGPGTVKITATAVDGSKVKASIRLTVSAAPEPTAEPTEEPVPTGEPEPVETPEDDKAVYRALLIGEVNFMIFDGESRHIDECKRNWGDVKMMTNMLRSVTGPNGSRYSIKTGKDVNYSRLRYLIQTTFADTTNRDVSLFFIATHGDSDGDGDLSLTDGDFTTYLSFWELAQWLTTYIRGEVIVFIESCGAGSAIYDRQEENSAAQQAKRAASFVSDAVQAFSAADLGIIVPGSTGDLRLPKFYVLAAARHRELSWGNADYNLFTEWLVRGVGSAKNSPADTNGDVRITLNELFTYIKSVGDHYSIYSNDEVYYQHVQRYPANSSYVLFRLR